METKHNQSLCFAVSKNYILQVFAGHMAFFVTFWSRNVAPHHFQFDILQEIET